MSDQWRLMLLVLALLVAESAAAVSYATMSECDANCSPSVYECSSGDGKRFSCSISAWFIVVLVVVGLALLVGIPTMCFGMYMCGMLACVYAFRKPRTRRKRNRNQRGRRNWRRRWRRPSRNKQLAVEEAEPIVPHVITRKIESGVCQSATVAETNEHSTSPMPQSPVRDMHTPIADASSTEPSHSQTAVSIPIGIEDSDSRRSSKVDSLYFPFYRS